MLAARIEDDLFNHQGEIANNFIQKMPDARQSLKAIGMFKDEYLLDFFLFLCSIKSYHIEA